MKPDERVRLPGGAGRDDVVPASEASRLEEKVRQLERFLGRKIMDVEILK